MKKLILLSLLLVPMAFSSCDSCECDCSGDVNIINQSGVSYSFEIRKKSTAIFQGSMSGNDDVWFGLEEGKFTFHYGEQSLTNERSFSIKDCETTTLVLSK
jgi:hypothetical protein